MAGKGSFSGLFGSCPPVSLALPVVDLAVPLKQVFLTEFVYLSFILGYTTPPKTNLDTKNDGLEDVFSFKHGYLGYPC